MARSVPAELEQVLSRWPGAEQRGREIVGRSGPVERRPEQAQKRSVGPHIAAFERPENLFSRLRLGANPQGELAGIRLQHDKTVSLRIGVHHVEFWAMDTQQLVFLQARGFRGFA